MAEKIVVKLEEWELKLLERLSKNKDGRDLIKYLERRITEWSDLDTLTPETVLPMKAAKQLITSTILEPIRNFRNPKEAETNRIYE